MPGKPCAGKFLSTPSARRATFKRKLGVRACGRFLSTPSARRATGRGQGQAGGVLISIHALREEGDTIRWETRASYGIFLSTPSARRATRPRLSPYIQGRISIHALREEGDVFSSLFSKYQHMISIHALREEGDPSEIAKSNISVLFLSTPSARRATSYERQHQGH